MITGWGSHHVDIAHWGMGWDDNGPVEVEGVGEYPPRTDLYNAAKRYKVHCIYPDGTPMTIAGGYPEIAAGTVQIKAIAREAGSRSKIAVISNDPHIDPIGSMVGQRGVRVSTVTSELSGEKIDIVEWNEDPALFIEEALSPAEVVSLELIDEQHRAIVTVTEDEQSLAIGKGGQNVRLAAKLTGWKIDIKSAGGDVMAGEEEKK